MPMKYSRETDVPPGWFLHRFGVGPPLLFSLSGDLILGRNALRSDRISKQHAILKLLDTKEYLIQDLDSTNGTFVNGEKVTSKGRVLEECDCISFGRIAPISEKHFGFVVRYKDPIEELPDLAEAITEDDVVSEKGVTDITVERHEKVNIEALVEPEEIGKGVADELNANGKVTLLIEIPEESDTETQTDCLNPNSDEDSLPQILHRFNTERDKNYTKRSIPKGNVRISDKENTGEMCNLNCLFSSTSVFSGIGSTNTGVPSSSDTRSRKRKLTINLSNVSSSTHPNEERHKSDEEGLYFNSSSNNNSSPKDTESIQSFTILNNLPTDQTPTDTEKDDSDFDGIQVLVSKVRKVNFSGITNTNKKSSKHEIKLGSVDKVDSRNLSSKKSANIENQCRTEITRSNDKLARTSSSKRKSYSSPKNAFTFINGSNIRDHFSSHTEINQNKNNFPELIILSDTDEEINHPIIKKPQLDDPRLTRYAEPDGPNIQFISTGSYSKEGRRTSSTSRYSKLKSHSSKLRSSDRNSKNTLRDSGRKKQQRTLPIIDSKPGSIKRLSDDHLQELCFKWRMRKVNGSLPTLPLPLTSRRRSHKKDDDKERVVPPAKKSPNVKSNKQCSKKPVLSKRQAHCREELVRKTNNSCYASKNHSRTDVKKIVLKNFGYRVPIPGGGSDVRR